VKIRVGKPDVVAPISKSVRTPWRRSVRARWRRSVRTWRKSARARWRSNVAQGDLRAKWPLPRYRMYLPQDERDAFLLR
jgi:hypothetical protein